MKKKYYVDFVEVSEKKFNERLEQEVESFCDENYDEWIDETNEDVEIWGSSYPASLVLERCDPIAYRCGLSDYKNYFLEDMQYDLDNYGKCEINGTEFEIEEDEEE